MDAVYFSIAFSALILTHIPSAIITVISLMLFALFLISWRDFSKTILRLATSAAFALLASAFYWIRIVNEVNWLAHYTDKYSTGFLGYQQWLFPNMLTGLGLSYSYFVTYLNLDVLILLTMFLFVPSFLFLLMKRGKGRQAERYVIFAIIVTAVFGFFMLSRASSFVWSACLPLQKIQFPWRWLAVLLFLGTVLFTVSTNRIFRRFRPYRTLIALSALGVVGMMLAYDVRQNFAHSNRVSREWFERLAADQSSGIRPSLDAWWWPIWARQEALDTRNPVIADNREVQILAWETTRRKFIVDEGAPTSVRVATFYYPYWRASVNGQSVEIDKDENGAITLPIEAEPSKIDLRFEEPPIYDFARWVSAITWTILLSLVLHNLVRKFRMKAENE